MAKTIMTATVVQSKGTTTHQVGHLDAKSSLVVDSEIETPCSLSIVLENGSVYLWRLNSLGECIADTWHFNVDEAKNQAELEFEIDSSGWLDAK